MLPDKGFHVPYFNFFSSWFVLIPETRCSFTGPCTFLKIVLSYMFNMSVSFSVTGCVSHPFITNGFNMILYILIFYILLTDLDFRILCKP
jgi:hypothetical protein